MFCYADVAKPDHITERLKKSVDRWRDVGGESDARVAERIRDDRIDILVDLTMHMSRGRPLVMALKPAPVQVAWLAYPGTTGLSAIDYRLTDPHLDPPGTADEFYIERSYRLADTFWCYDPLCVEPLAGDLPADRNDYIVFGCLNNFCKVTTPTLELWSKVLVKVPRSQLLLLAGEGSHRTRLTDYFAERGISADRIRFERFQPRDRYLRLYQQIDLGLDTIPYNGHTTSLDSFWMGVPVVTRVGQTAVGRAGLSQLRNLELIELAAATDEAFVSIAVELANDRARLRSLRQTLRTRMEASALMDYEKFARSFEDFFRFAWGEFCRNGQ